MDKKKIFLSFKPEYFKPFLYGIKKYEYRKRFCKVGVIAYLYLSTPIKQVVGIVKFDKPIEIEKELEKYKSNTAVYNRIKSFNEQNIKFAIPIKSLKLYKDPISLYALKEIDTEFCAPQSYLNIKNKPKILKFLDSREMFDFEFEREFDDVLIDDFCVSVNEIEQTEEFKNKDNVMLQYICYKKS